MSTVRDMVPENYEFAGMQVTRPKRHVTLRLTPEEAIKVMNALDIAKISLENNIMNLPDDYTAEQIAGFKIEANRYGDLRRIAQVELDKYNRSFRR